MSGNYLMVEESIIEELKSGEVDITEFLYESEHNKEDYLNIDKSWHGIHFLLCADPCGGEKPLFNVVMGGEEINEEDVGYGPARYLTSLEVSEVFEAIKDITKDELSQKFDLEEFSRNDIYPNYQSQEDFKYLWFHFEQLKNFFEKASNVHKAVIVYIN